MLKPFLSAKHDPSRKKKKKQSMILLLSEEARRALQTGDCTANSGSGTLK
jgi:hypothetical protein